MADISKSLARRMWRRQFGQLYLVAFVVTLVPHTAAWAVPKFLEARMARLAAAEVDRAEAALISGRVDEALARVDRALSTDVGAERARAIKASALFERFWEQKAAGDLQAARALTAGLAQSRESAALVARGNLALVDRDAPRAVALMTEAVGASPDSAYAQHQLGFALNQAGRAEDALAHFTRALALAPDMAWVQSNLANLLASLGRCEEKIPALRLEPRLECLNAVGVARFRSGRFLEARATFARAVELGPEQGNLRANYASSLLQTGDRAGAIEQAARAKALGVADHPIFAALGMK